MIFTRIHLGSTVIDLKGKPVIAAPELEMEPYSNAAALRIAEELANRPLLFESCTIVPEGGRKGNLECHLWLGSKELRMDFMPNHPSFQGILECRKGDTVVYGINQDLNLERDKITPSEYLFLKERLF